MKGLYSLRRNRLSGFLYCILFLLLLLPAMASAQLAQSVNFINNGVYDNSGNPVESGNIYFYEPGGTTKRTIWTDQNRTTVASNPITTTSAGRPDNPGESGSPDYIYAYGAYRIVVKDELDATTYIDIPYAFFGVGAGVIATQTEEITSYTAAGATYTATLPNSASYETKAGKLHVYVNGVRERQIVETSSTQVAIPGPLLASYSILYEIYP